MPYSYLRGAASQSSEHVSDKSKVFFSEYRCLHRLCVPQSPLSLQTGQRLSSKILVPGLSLYFQSEALRAVQ